MRDPTIYMIWQYHEAQRSYIIIDMDVVYL